MLQKYGFWLSDTVATVPSKYTVEAAALNQGDNVFTAATSALRVRAVVVVGM